VYRPVLHWLTVCSLHLRNVLLSLGVGLALAASDSGLVTAAADNALPVSTSVLRREVWIVVPEDASREDLPFGSITFQGQPELQLDAIPSTRPGMTSATPNPLVCVDRDYAPLADRPRDVVRSIRSDTECWFEVELKQGTWPIPETGAGHLSVRLHNPTQLAAGLYRGEHKFQLQATTTTSGLPTLIRPVVVEVFVIRCGQRLRSVRFDPLADPPQFGQPLRVDLVIDRWSTSEATIGPEGLCLGARVDLTLKTSDDVPLATVFLADAPPRFSPPAAPEAASGAAPAVSSVTADQSGALPSRPSANSLLTGDSRYVSARFVPPREFSGPSMDSLWNDVFLDLAALGLRPRPAADTPLPVFLYNARTSPRGSGPETWVDPVAWLEPTPVLPLSYYPSRKASETAGSQVQPLESFRAQWGTRVWRVGFPAVDLLGDIRVEAQLMAFAPSETKLQKSRGVEPGTLSDAPQKAAAHLSQSDRLSGAVLLPVPPDSPICRELGLLSTPIVKSEARLRPGFAAFPTVLVAGDSFLILAADYAEATATVPQIRAEHALQPETQHKPVLTALPKGLGRRFAWPSEPAESRGLYGPGRWDLSVDDDWAKAQQLPRPDSQLYVDLEFLPVNELLVLDGSLPWIYSFPRTGRKSLAGLFQPVERSLPEGVEGEGQLPVTRTTLTAADVSGTGTEATALTLLPSYRIASSTGATAAGAPMDSFGRPLLVYQGLQRLSLGVAKDPGIPPTTLVQPTRFTQGEQVEWNVAAQFQPRPADSAGREATGAMLSVIPGVLVTSFPNGQRVARLVERGVLVVIEDGSVPLTLYIAISVVVAGVLGLIYLWMKSRHSSEFESPESRESGTASTQVPELQTPPAASAASTPSEPDHDFSPPPTDDSPGIL
jgi:hypothetical protein